MLQKNAVASLCHIINRDGDRGLDKGRALANQPG